MGVDPVSLIAVSALASTLIGTGVSAYGQYQATKAANKQADYQAQVAANNAASAEMEARYAESQGAKNAEAQRRKTALFIGAQRAKMGASGATADQGSFLDLQLDTAQQGELDAMALMNEGTLAAWRARTQGANYTAQSGLYKMSKTDPALGAAGTLLSGAGQAGMGYFNATGGAKYTGPNASTALKLAGGTN